MPDDKESQVMSNTTLVKLLVAVLAGGALTGGAMFGGAKSSASQHDFHVHETMPGHPIMVERMDRVSVELSAQGEKLDTIRTSQIVMCERLEVDCD